MSFDRVKVSKVETILAGLTPTEQIHIAAFAAKLCGTAPPVPAVPAPSMHAAANARISAALAADPTLGPLSRLNMHQRLRRGDLIEFTDRRGVKQRARITTINTKTVSCGPPDGSSLGWRVPPHMIRLVGEHPPLPKAPAATAHPTAAGAGNW